MPDVFLTFGLGDIDKSTALKWNGYEYGEINFDPSFNPATPRA